MSERPAVPERNAAALPGQVEQAVGLLRGVDERDVSDRAEVFDEVHRLLQDALAEVEGG